MKTTPLVSRNIPSDGASPRRPQPTMLSLQSSSPYEYNHNHNHSSPAAALGQQAQQARAGRKRKAEAQDNDRLTKRLGCLNIGMSTHHNPFFLPGSAPAHPIEYQPGANSEPAAGQNLRKLYATVEDDPANRPAPSPLNGPAGGDSMQLDDSKHKVYIYNLDDELSSSESEPEDGKIIFLPDIERALRANRIPPVVRANSEGQLGGKSIEDMQLVLYNVPSSLTVAPEHDSVRKAILEARARARREQEKEAEGGQPAPASDLPVSSGQMAVGGTPAHEVQQGAASEDGDAMDLS